ncbi:hypothetical protein BJV74DRAFT_292229 [Russula compacta]|nr:hypothetical protein BJV74DRAFT_292229 [Russula compacta]
MTSLLTSTRGCNGTYSSYVLPRVVRLTIETNALTASVALIAFVLYVAFPNKAYFGIPIAIIGKLYTNTFFLTLNNRIYFRDHPPPGNSASFTPPDPGLAFQPAASPLHFVRHSLSQSTATSHTSARLDASLPTLSEDREKRNSDITIVVSDPST